MHINESSRRKMGGTVDVNLGDTVSVNLGYFGAGKLTDDTEQGGSSATDWNTYTPPPSLTVEQAYPPQVIPGREQEQTGPSIWDQINRLTDTVGRVAPGVITAVEGGQRPGGMPGPKPGTSLYQKPNGNLGIIVPIAIGAVVLVGAALYASSSKKPAMAGYGRAKRRKMRR